MTDHRVDELRRELSRLTVKIGLASFVTHVIAPLTALVGDAWATGALAIFEEHLYTESVQGGSAGDCLDSRSRRRRE